MNCMDEIVDLLKKIQSTINIVSSQSYQTHMGKKGRTSHPNFITVGRDGQYFTLLLYYSTPPTVKSVQTKPR